MTFKNWILCHVGENSPLGDLANDVVTDGSFPETESKEEIETYLDSKNACEGALNAFNHAWNMYKNL